MEEIRAKARVLEHSARRQKPSAPSPETVMRTCPICSRELEERKCKLFCPDPVCGYFLSCADYY